MALKKKTNRFKRFFDFRSVDGFQRMAKTEVGPGLYLNKMDMFVLYCDYIYFADAFAFMIADILFDHQKAVLLIEFANQLLALLSE